MIRGMDVVQSNIDTVDYDAISDRVRGFCAERLYDLERGLRPLVDGSFGEVLPGHLNAYLTLLRDLAKLYRAHERPRDLEQMLPVSKVQELIAHHDQMWEQRLAEQIAAAELRVRMEAASGQKLTIQAAKATVSARLLELEKRQA